MFPSKFFLDDVFNLEDKNKMKCDVYEKENNIVIEIDMPGFNKNDIKLELNNGTINIIAERKIEEHDDDKKYLCRERKFYGKYQRSFYLGEIEDDKINATFNNGILNIIIPKRQKEETKKFIEIK